MRALGVILMLFQLGIDLRPARAEDVTPETLPIGKVLLGYEYEYQAILSKTDRTHQVRNVPGGGVIPVHWKSKEEDILSCYIPRSSKSDGRCDWCTTSTALTRFVKGTSTLHYGVNKDEYQKDVVAFLLQTDANAAVPNAPPMSHLKGKFSTADGERTFTVSLNLVCTASGKPGAMQVHYFALAEPTSSVKMQLVRSDVRSGDDDGIAVHWEGLGDDLLEKVGRYPIVVTQNTIIPQDHVSPRDGWPVLTRTFNDHVDIVKGTAVLFYAGKEIARFAAPVYGHKGQ